MRLRLIEVAERLYAERGVNGVSLREIGATAGQRNTGAVRYHFGSKAGLIDAIFRHRMTPINRRRLAMFEEAEARGLDWDVPFLARAFLLPLSEALGQPGRPTWYLRFCVQAATVEGVAAVDLGRQQWTAGVALVRERLLACLADMPAELRNHRWTMFALYLTHAMADREMGLQAGRVPLLQDRSAWLADLVHTSVALVTAPASVEERLVPS